VRLLLHNGASLTLKNREGLSPVQVLLRAPPRPMSVVTLTLGTLTRRNTPQHAATRRNMHHSLPSQACES
jgi:hypothetical protein